MFLVDTYDTIEGVRRAIAVGEQLRARGHALAGVRLDSGDLVALSQAARRLLDAAGFQDAAIVASNDLDELEIMRLHAAGARISVWGVGTRLVTGHDQPALGGVYKLAAVRGDASQPWQYRIKLSEEPIKVSNPGVQQVLRHRGADGGFVCDVIHETELGTGAAAHRIDAPAERFVPEGEGEPLLVPLLRAGVPVYTPPPLAESRARTLAQLERLPAGVRKLQEPERYPVGLDERLQTLKDGLIAKARSGA